MKQLASSPSGINVIDVPSPTPRPGEVLVQVQYSCVSPGSELAAIASHRESLLQKARARPEKALAVWRVLRSKGVAGVRERLERQTTEYRPLGYSIAGVVSDPAGTDFQAAERVACAGAGYAVHAEYVAVPRNLVCRIPAPVPSLAASSVALGAIALQGLRRAEIEPGAVVVVLGLGAVGQITARLAVASGCNVWVSDLDHRRVAMAVGADRRVRALGERAEDDVPLDGIGGSGGADSVVITAATREAGVLDAAAKLCRVRGRIVIVGDVPIQADRDSLYAKELELRLSCSYGPGRYDPSYELEGVDYPLGFVRWTANRNMQTYLETLATAPHLWTGLWPEPVPLAQAPELFSRLERRSDTIGFLSYRPDSTPASSLPTTAPSSRPIVGICRFGVIGAGDFVRETHLPLLAAQAGVRLEALATHNVLIGERLQRRYHFRLFTSSADELLAASGVDAVLIGVRHHEHARLVIAALRAGKHVFVEKPLALRDEDVHAIRNTLAATGRLLMVGFNRRFAPATDILARAMGRDTGHGTLHYRFAAGPLPGNHWVNGPEGGGRVVGEACHAVDLVEYLFGPIRSALFSPLGSPPRDRHSACVTMILQAERGTAHVTYTDFVAQGGRKELIELWAGGRTLAPPHFRRPTGRFWRPVEDKGHRGCLEAFVRAMRDGGPPPIAYDSLIRTARLAIIAQRAADAGNAEAWSVEGSA